MAKISVGIDSQRKDGKRSVFFVLSHKGTRKRLPSSVELLPESDLKGKKNYNSIDAMRIAGAAVVVAAHTIYVGNTELEGVSFSLYYTVFQYLGRVVVPFFLV